MSAADEITAPWTCACGADSGTQEQACGQRAKSSARKRVNPCRQAASPGMTAQLDHDSSREPMSAHEPARRSGSIVLVLLVAGAIVAVALALTTIGRAQAQPYILGLLALLAMVGLFNLFAYAAGIIRFADRTTDDPVVRRIADQAHDGIAVTDPGGHMVYFNAAYLALTGAATALDVRPVERVFIGNPDVSEAVFRLLKAAREGKRQQEEVRIAGQDGTHGRWLRMRVRPLDQSKRHAKYAVWSIADITRDRERQEDVFKELQHAIEYLDHAPCGFFSVSPSGEVVYVNATLAGWLDHDLAEIGSGGLKLTDIVSGDGASLLTSCAAARPCRCGSITSSRSAPTACPARRARSSSAAPATSIPIRSVPPKCASCASSTIRRWRSRPWIAPAPWCAPMPASPSWRRASVRTVPR